MARKQIWTDKACEIVKIYWSSVGVGEIRGMLIYYLHHRCLAEGKSNFFMPTIGGILYQAKDMGLIDDAEYVDMKKHHARKPLSVELRSRVLSNYEYKCAVCGCNEVSSLEIDHIRPVVFGGITYESNLQVLCKSCHKIKGIDTIDVRKMLSEIKIMIDSGKDVFYLKFPKGCSHTSAARKLADIYMSSELTRRGIEFQRE